MTHVEGCCWRRTDDVREARFAMPEQSQIVLADPPVPVLAGSDFVGEVTRWYYTAEGLCFEADLLSRAPDDWPFAVPKMVVGRGGICEVTALLLLSYHQDPNHPRHRPKEGP